MNFTSDNASGASDKVLAAIIAANTGVAVPYGADAWTAKAEMALCDLFERHCAVFLVPTGTAANALALACLTPPWGAIFCHEDAHVMDDECGAPEFFSGGAKLIGLKGACGKISPAFFADALRAYPHGLIKQVQPAALTLTQATECGTLYTLAEIAELSDLAHAAGIGVHMDGARFANAVVALDATPAEMSWKAGIDVLSFGASKNGTLCCEAVIFFDKSRAVDFAYRRKRAGHTLSKGRFLGAQVTAYLEGDHWLELARTANARAAQLSKGLANIAGVRMPWPSQANEVFAVLPLNVEAQLKMAGARYYDWGVHGLADPGDLRDDEIFLRLVASFATSEAEVDQFVATVRAASVV